MKNFTLVILGLVVMAALSAAAAESTPELDRRGKRGAERSEGDNLFKFLLFIMKTRNGLCKKDELKSNH
jgi:hypothetical protein